MALLERLPEPRAALLRRYGELFGDPRFSHRRWGERLDQALARLDRYSHFGVGREGAGLDFAIELLEGEAEEVRWGRRKAPKSLAYYVPLLEDISKRWRRGQASRAAAPPEGWRSTWAHPKAKKKGRRTQ